MSVNVNVDDEFVHESTDGSEPQAHDYEAGTISDIVDNDMAVDDLTSDEDEREPRLFLLNLNSKEKKAKQKRQKGQFSLGLSRETSDMPLNTRFMPPRSKFFGKHDKEPKKSFIPSHLQTPLEKPINHLPPLARIHRREHSNLWKETFGKDQETTEIVDLPTLKKRMSTNRWKLLLEEMYEDKKYLDYVQQTKKSTEKDLFTSADDGLTYLYGRADFWEQRLPIPERPPSSVKRMFSRHNENGKLSSPSLIRSASSISASKRVIPRTPSTQLSRLQRRNTVNKKNTKEDTKKTSAKKGGEKDNRLQFHGISSIKSSATSTRPAKSETSIEPDKGKPDDREVVIPYAQLTVTPIRGSPELDNKDMEPAPITREVTRSDIKLDEFVLDDDFNHQVFGYDEGAYDEMNV